MSVFGKTAHSLPVVFLLIAAFTAICPPLFLHYQVKGFGVAYKLGGSLLPADDLFSFSGFKIPVTPVASVLMSLFATFCLWRSYTASSLTKLRLFTAEFKGNTSISSKYSSGGQIVPEAERALFRSSAWYSLYLVNFLFTAIYLFCALGLFSKTPAVYNYCLSVGAASATVLLLTASPTARKP